MHNNSMLIKTNHYNYIIPTGGWIEPSNGYMQFKIIGYDNIVRNFIFKWLGDVKNYTIETNYFQSTQKGIRYIRYRLIVIYNKIFKRGVETHTWPGTDWEVIDRGQFIRSFKLLDCGAENLAKIEEFIQKEVGVKKKVWREIKKFRNKERKEVATAEGRKIRGSIRRGKSKEVK